MGTSAERQSLLAPYYVLQNPAARLTICLDPDAVDRIQREALGLDSSEEFGDHELAGVLLGTKEVHGTQVTTIVTQFRTICPVRRDSSALPPLKNEEPAFGGALQQFTLPSDSPLQILGYYRTHHGDGLYLSGDDLDIVHAHFRDPESIVMLVKALPVGACTAGFFFWDNGRIQPEFPQIEAPFGPMVSATPVARRHQSSSLHNVFPAPGADAVRTRNLEHVIHRPVSVVIVNSAVESRKRPHAWLLLIICLVILAAAGLSVKFWPLQSDQATSVRKPLGIDVLQTDDGHLKFTWDVARPEISHGQMAGATIRDGTRIKRIPLTGAQLRAGMVSYAPATEDIEFSLNIQDRNRTVVDSLRVTIPAASTPGSLPHQGIPEESGRRRP